jgi:peptidoglycan/xylan/chitin deacetylase (PgdA/CDA1 family)
MLGEQSPLILMYHRVATPEIDPWGLAVAPSNFDEQMAIIAKTRHPVPLSWLASEIKHGRRPSRAVAVTFDDAYVDVLTHGAPSLARHGVPATLFVVTGFLGQRAGFWWDVLANGVFTGKLNDQLSELPWVDEKARRQLRAAQAGADRSAYHLALWSAIRLLPPDGRMEAAKTVANMLEAKHVEPAGTMTSEEIRGLSNSGGFEIGAHTVSHPSLPMLGEADQRREIVKSRDTLSDLLGQPCRGVAYPFGDFDRRTESIARGANFDYAVSTAHGSPSSAREIFRLPRIDIKNWNSAAFTKSLAEFG